MLKNIIDDFDIERFTRFFRDKNRAFTPIKEKQDRYNDKNFIHGLKLGEIKFTDYEEMIICAFEVTQPLTERSGKKAQYEKAKKILKETQSDSGILIFYDQNGNFRFSLIYANYLGTKRDWSNFRRFTYFVCKEFTNKTFLQRIGKGDFSTLEKIKDAFSVEKVTKQFYKDISYWYFWAIQNTEFPKDAKKEKNGRNIAIIRLITRLIFIWFMRERKLIPKNLFDHQKIKKILKDISPDKTTYYKAILQNLFFATLNTKERKYRFQISGWKNSNYMVHSVYRYKDYFSNSSEALILFKEIPFLNGGLFDCLDRSSKQNNNQGEVRIDGFSDKEVGLKFPNFLFFSEETNADLNKDFGTKYKNYKVQGLINILSAYNFTIDENDPNDQEVALDPELLGKVFENLLASFNPETSSTARKATGSYYTPREIVDYMVMQSLKEYFKTHLKDIEELEKKLDELFAADNENNPFDEEETKNIVMLIDALRIVDPAVGSGAFPMGILNKLVFILAKLDPENYLWKQTQINALEQSIPDPVIKRKLTEQIEKHFKDKNPDYGRKLHLIQKCIYGVDIQQTAVEIAKLRFFISLLVDEKIDKSKDNWGIEPLPNLDFKIMQGNSLISEFMGINFDDDSKRGNSLFEDETDMLIIEFQQKKSEYQNEPDKRKKDKLKEEIEDLIIKIFETKLHKQKASYFSKLKSIEDKYSILPNEKHRNEMIAKERHDLYKKTGFDLDEVEKQLREFTGGNKTKPFFLWKLYFAEVFQGDNPGFDIVIANPPYVDSETMTNKEPDFRNKLKDLYVTAKGNWDLFVVFVEKGINLLNSKGIFSYIIPNKLIGAKYTEELRKYLQNLRIIEIRDYSRLNVFIEQDVYPVTILLSNDNSKNGTYSIMFTLMKKINIPQFSNLISYNNFIKNIYWDKYFFTNKIVKILSKILSNPKLLSFNDKIFGAATVNEAYKVKNCLIDSNDEIGYKLINTGTIDPYLSLWGVKKTQYIKHSYHFPRINKLDLKKINTTREKQSHSVKLIIAGMSNRLESIYDEGEYLAAKSTTIVMGEKDKLKYLIAIINSKLLSFFINYFYYSLKMAGGYLNISKNIIENLPIPKSSFENQQSFIKLVDQILNITKSEDYYNNPEKQAKVKLLEKEIDKLVYELYGLMEEEIRIVEGKND